MRYINITQCSVQITSLSKIRISYKIKDKTILFIVPIGLLKFPDLVMSIYPKLQVHIDYKSNNVGYYS